MATIKKRESGRWEARVRRKGGKAVSRTFAVKNDAIIWAREHEREIERGVWFDTTTASRISLEELLVTYVEKVAGPRGSPAELSRIERFIEELGEYSLERLSPRVLITWRDERLRSVAPGTVAREMTLLGAAISWGMKEQLIPLPVNPVSAISRPRVTDARKRRLEKDEEVRLMAAMESKATPGTGRKRKGNYQTGTRQVLLRPIVQFALETAMRQGEILTLTWDHVDFEECTAHLPLTKNGEARTVPLSTRALAILEERRKVAVEASTDGEVCGRVFPATPDSLKKAWARALLSARQAYERECAEANRRPDQRLLDLRFHDLRHEATSRLAEKLTNVMELASVTGHRDLRMLQRYYHPRAADLAKKLG